MRRILIPLIFGLGGVAVLVSLGLWQLKRLEWKEAVLAQVQAQIAGDPQPLPTDPDPETARFLPVTATGRVLNDGVRVLISIKQVGAGHRLINVFETDTGRRVLLDRGFLAQDATAAPLSAGAVTVTGNLHWPRETDGFTPDPDLKTGIWFARDVAAMAAHLGTEPLLIVARDIQPADPVVQPLPVTTAGIPNDHLEYAITWFSLAAVWLGMTALLLWRIRQKTA